MAGTSKETDIIALCRTAFDGDDVHSESSVKAMKTLANTLLLQEETRQLFADSGYATRSIQGNIAYYALKYSGQEDREGKSDSPASIKGFSPLDTRALSESLKLLFNLCQFYPERRSPFNETLPDLLSILFYTNLEPKPLQPPVNYLINALLNLDLPGSAVATPDKDSVDSTPFFPRPDPTLYTKRLISILDLAVQNEKEEELETSAIALLTLLRRVIEVAPKDVLEYMRSELLPSDCERDRPLGKSDSLASQVLKLSTAPTAPKLKEGVSSLLFELSAKDPATFVRNVGYGYAAGYLMTHDIPVPSSLNASDGDAGDKITSVDGQEINPITGQRRDMEPPDPGLDMTDEEKEREAERLFVLFERLKATGVINVTNPVEQAAREATMSIVPYAANRQVVLRHNDSIVLYDPQSKQFGVSSQRGLDVTECPYCHQPLHREDTARKADHSSSGTPPGAGFVSPEYFRMLQDSLPGSANSSTPPSPRRRLVEPVRTSDHSTRSSVRPAEYFSNRLPTPPSPNGISASAFSPGYFKRFFVVEKELGRGGKGVVLLVTHVLDNVDLGQYACKRVPVGNDHAWLTNVLNEVRLLEHLSHQHLVYYKHVWLEDIKISNFGPSVPCAFILQQYCNAGDLHQYIANPALLAESTQALKERVRRRSKNQMEQAPDLQARKLRFEEIYSFFKDITSGLNHLHVNGFIHRDLKPSNCLLHDAGKGLRALVSDFGEVQIANMVRKSTGATGTVSYCAPEVLRLDPSTGALGNFTTKSDIFSLGMILYFLCFARLPYRNADHMNEENEDLDLLKAEIVAWSGLHEERKLRPDLPEQLYTFLRRLLSLEPGERPSAEDILLGIKTGSGLDDISDSRTKPTTHMYDDLPTSSRISAIDTPQKSSAARKLPSGYLRPSRGSSRLRLSPFLKKEDSRSKSPAAAVDDDDFDDDDAEPDSPSDSLILRGRFSSPTRIPEAPIPIRSSPGGPWWLDLRNATTLRSIKVVILLSKAISLTTLCAPMATRSAVTYPLLALAALDFVLSSGLGVSVLLAGLHVAVLLVLAPGPSPPSLDSDSATSQRQHKGRKTSLEGVSGDNAPDIAEADLPSGADGAPVVAAEVHVEPADDDRGGTIGAHCDEKEGAVLEVSVVVGDAEDDETRYGYGVAHEDEDKAVLEQVAEESDDQGEGEGGSPRGDAEQLCTDLAVAVRSDDGWGEIRVAVSRDDEAKVHEAAEEDLEIFKDVKDVAGSNPALDRGFPLVFFKTCANVIAFVWLEPGHVF
ncbi:MAG: hypothetical protein Q9163_002135 [Psora crenata]